MPAENRVKRIAMNLLLATAMLTSACSSPGPGGADASGDANASDRPGIVDGSDGAIEPTDSSTDGNTLLDAIDAVVSDAPATDSSTVDAPSVDAGDAADGRCLAPEVPPAGSVELAPIASNFDTAPLIVAGGPVPGSAAPDVVGAFRTICNASHEAYDDPMVFPCEPGRAHLHEFFGNTLTNAFSNYASLRTSGDSTCENALDRSAYWAPAMTNGHGRVVRPDYMTVYYKRFPETATGCTRTGTSCAPLPRGLRLEVGYDSRAPMSTVGRASFYCVGPTAGSSRYPDLVEAASHCPAGNQLGVSITTPTCWNGRDLDSADHRSHLAYTSYGTGGFAVCPSTHPIVIPAITLGILYTTDDDLDRSGTWTAGVTSTWQFSSDTNADGSTLRPGTSFHASWWGAWDDDVMQRWDDHCLDRLLSCTNGQLGDGTSLRRFAGFSWTASPRVVDPPPHP